MNDEPSISKSPLEKIMWSQYDPDILASKSNRSCLCRLHRSCKFGEIL